MLRCPPMTLYVHSVSLSQALTYMFLLRLWVALPLKM